MTATLLRNPSPYSERQRNRTPEKKALKQGKSINRLALTGFLSNQTKEGRLPQIVLAFFVYLDAGKLFTNSAKKLSFLFIFIAK